MKNKILYYSFLGLLIVVIACKKQAEKPSPILPIEKNKKEIRQPISELDSVRKIIVKTYKQAKKIDDTPEVLPTATNPSMLCKPCDMEYLIYLNSKKDYNIDEVKKLLCLDDNDQCVNNAEFTQFYNEIIYKVFQRERNDFTDEQIQNLLKDGELIEELLQPVQDNTDRTLLDALKADALNPND